MRTFWKLGVYAVFALVPASASAEACPAPTIKAIERNTRSGPTPFYQKADLIAPDYNLLVRGCGFLPRSGQKDYGRLWLTGLVEPAAKKKYPGGRVELMVSSWNERPSSSDGSNWEIYATVREFKGQPGGNNIEGVLHQPKGAGLVVTTHDGHASAPFEVPFRAKEEVRDFNDSSPRPLVSISCSDHTNDDKCRSNGNRLEGYHRSYTHWAPTGTDTFAFNLLNGWHVADVSALDPGTLFGSCKGSAEHAWGNNVVKFYWRMSTVAKCNYSVSVRVAGPKGTNYR